MVDAVLYLIEVWPSSLEVLLLLHADVFLMQNWAHVARVLSLLNATPSETRDTDFSRVRPYALDGLSGRLRQTLLLAAGTAVFQQRRRPSLNFAIGCGESSATSQPCSALSATRSPSATCYRRLR